MYEQPQDADAALDDLREIGVDARNGIRWELKVARQKGQMDGEFDYRKSRDLGLTSRIHGGVKCGVAHTYGARTTWVILDRMPPEMVSAVMQEGYVLRVDDERNPLGRPSAVGQTFVESLVKPHDCELYRKYRPGLSPDAHVGERRERLRTAAYVAAGIGGVAAIVLLVLALT